MDTYGFNACRWIDKAPPERQAPGVYTPDRDEDQDWLIFF